MANQLLWEIARSRLREAGYSVEKDSYYVYAREPGHVGVDRVPIVSGKCSERSVTKLVNKIKARGLNTK